MAQAQLRPLSNVEDQTPAPDRRATAFNSKDLQRFRHAYLALRVGFTAAPIIAGLDKFFNVMVDWQMYLAPFLKGWFGPQNFMYGVGIIEIIAGIGVALKPRIFAYVVSAWLFGIIGNLVIQGRYWDIALRDLGLALGAFALGRMAQSFEAKRIGPRSV